MNAAAPATRIGHRLTRWFDNPVVSAFLSPRTLDDYLELVDPTWTVRAARARVVAVRQEASGTVTLVLRPGPGFRGHRAGQHVPLTVDLDGRATTRVFSIASPENRRELEITIKRSPKGTVSRWALDDAEVGDIVTLGEAAGDFVLPETLPPAFLFISGGSGVTPIRSLVETLVESGFGGPIGVLVYARDDEGAIYLERFRSLARRCSNLAFRVARTRGSSPPIELHGRFDAAHLDSFGIPLETATVYACGPATLLAAVSGFASARGIEVRTERFHLPMPAASTSGTRRILFRSSGHEAFGSETTPILVDAEASGLPLTHGCRRGICHRCACTLARGAVRNLVTGEIDDEAGQTIRPCVSAPLTDVEVIE